MRNTRKLKLKTALVIYLMWVLILSVPYLFFNSIGILSPIIIALIMTANFVLRLRYDDKFQTVSDVVKARRGIILLNVIFYLAMIAIIGGLFWACIGKQPFIIPVALWGAPLVTAYLWGAVSDGI